MFPCQPNSTHRRLCWLREYTASTGNTFKNLKGFTGNLRNKHGLFTSYIMSTQFVRATKRLLANVFADTKIMYWYTWKDGGKK